MSDSARAWRACKHLHLRAGRDAVAAKEDGTNASGRGHEEDYTTDACVAELGSGQRVCAQKVIREGECLGAPCLPPMRPPPVPPNRVRKASNDLKFRSRSIAHVGSSGAPLKSPHRTVLRACEPSCERSNALCAGASRIHTTLPRLSRLPASHPPTLFSPNLLLAHHVRTTVP